MMLGVELKAKLGDEVDLGFKEIDMMFLIVHQLLKAMGRGLDHFRKEGAKLEPPPTGDDPYEDEAYRLWAIKQQGK